MIISNKRNGPPDFVPTIPPVSLHFKTKLAPLLAALVPFAIAFGFWLACH